VNRRSVAWAKAFTSTAPRKKPYLDFGLPPIIVK